MLLSVFQDYDCKDILRMAAWTVLCDVNQHGRQRSHGISELATQ